MRSTFGFHDEILVVFSDYTKNQPSMMQAVERLFAQQPYKARANPLVFFLVSKASDINEFVGIRVVLGRDKNSFSTVKTVVAAG